MRKTEAVTVAADNRDYGKTFVITEMPAWQALQWCAKALLALSQSGTDIKPGALAKAAQGGPETIATLGLEIFTLVPPAVALPLMAEIRACVSFQAPGAAVTVSIKDTEHSQVEEISTWFVLLKHAFILHLGFLPAAPPPTTE
jgi:hypothetical protein